MLIKVKVPKEKMRKPQNMKDNEMNDIKLFVQYNPEVKSDSCNDISSSWSLHFMIPMRVLNFILGIAGVYLSL